MATDTNHDLPDLSSGLQGLFLRNNWAAIWQTYTLGRKWVDIVGKNIAKKSEPAYIQKNTLWIYVESSVLMQHMQPQKLTLLEKINAMLPDAGIRDIRWAMQPARPVGETTGKAATPLRRADPEEKAAFEAMASTVEDKKCREALKKLWRTFHHLQS